MGYFRDVRDPSGVLAALGVLAGLLFSACRPNLAYYATAGSILLVRRIVTLLGLTPMFLPHLCDHMVMLGYIQINGPTAELLDHLSAPEQD